jgi:hypothetical protein
VLLLHRAAGSRAMSILPSRGAPARFEQSDSGLTLTLPPCSASEPDPVVVFALGSGDR